MVAQTDWGVMRILKSEQSDGPKEQDDGEGRSMRSLEVGLEYLEAFLATLLHVHRPPVKSDRPYRRGNLGWNRGMRKDYE